MDGTTGRSGFNPLQRQKDFSSSLYAQTGCGVHLASCPVDTGGTFPGCKARRGRDFDHLPPPNPEVMNE
jgi:hypothetical protein